jgi:hypothetical protein
VERLEEIAEWALKAKALYEKIVKRQGNEALIWHETAIVRAPVKSLPVEPKRIDTPKAAEAAVAPLPRSRSADTTSARRVRYILVLLGQKSGRHIVLVHQGG